MVLINLVNPYYLLFLPAIPDSFRIPEARASVNRKLNGGNPPIYQFPCKGTNPGAPGAPAAPETKIPENWYSSREFGSFGTASRAPGAQTVHRLSTTTVDNLIGVWEF